MAILSIVSSFVCLFCFTSAFPIAPLHPVILVPGDGGSQFEAKINKSSSVHWYCRKQEDWFLLWLSLLGLSAIDCTVDNMRLVYDNVTHTTKNVDGVEIRQPGFGNTSTVEWLDPTHPLDVKTLSYFYFIVDELVTTLNYTRNKDIRGAPYDFRKAPNEMDVYIKNLTSLVEETFYLNNNQKVVVLGHSMGTLYVLYMLNQQSQDWKDKFIHSFISLGGPWAGSVKPIRLMASGDALGQSSHVIDPLRVRPLQRSIPSTAFLMPYDTFWSDKEILVYGPKRNYTVNDYQQFFNDIDFRDGYFMRKDTENLIKKLVAPGVEVHCLYGNNVTTTPEAFSYAEVKVGVAADAKWYDEQPKVIYGDGDGTVNIRSLEACKRWTSQQKQKVTIQNFPEAEHLAMLYNPDILSYIKKVIQS